MNYELTKELKDAGFPQKGCSFLTEHSFVFEETNSCTYAPTLSELIEACGDFEMLGRSSEEWFSEGMQTPRVYGSTPEEAVAKLWLALNKK